jgi:hypothetical protein
LEEDYFGAGAVEADVSAVGTARSVVEEDPRHEADGLECGSCGNEIGHSKLFKCQYDWIQLDVQITQNNAVV